MHFSFAYYTNCVRYKRHIELAYTYRCTCTLYTHTQIESAPNFCGETRESHQHFAAIKLCEFWQTKHRHMTYFQAIWVTVSICALQAIIENGYYKLDGRTIPVFIYIKHSHFRSASTVERDSNHLPIEIRLHPLFEINYHGKCAVCAHASMRYKTPLSLHFTLTIPLPPSPASLFILLNHRPNIIPNEWNRSNHDTKAEQTQNNAIKVSASIGENVPLKLFSILCMGQGTHSKMDKLL